jgi:hypothetical protein
MELERKGSPRWMKQTLPSVDTVERVAAAAVTLDDAAAAAAAAAASVYSSTIPFFVAWVLLMAGVVTSMIPAHTGGVSVDSEMEEAYAEVRVGQVLARPAQLAMLGVAVMSNSAYSFTEPTLKHTCSGLSNPPARLARSCSSAQSPTLRLRHSLAFWQRSLRRSAATRSPTRRRARWTRDRRLLGVLRGRARARAVQRSTQ